MQKSLLVDIQYCIGCRACEVACKQETNIPAGVKRINVVKIGPRVVGGKLKMDFIPMRCRHCAKAPCIDACPVKAISKRSDGIVIVDGSLCNGCMSCAEACPLGVINLNPEKQIAEKCNLCIHLVDAGMEPACVHHCPSKCMYFGDINEIIRVVQERQAKRLVEEEDIV